MPVDLALCAAMVYVGWSKVSQFSCGFHEISIYLITAGTICFICATLRYLALFCDRFCLKKSCFSKPAFALELLAIVSNQLWALSSLLPRKNSRK